MIQINAIFKIAPAAILEVVMMRKSRCDAVPLTRFDAQRAQRAQRQLQKSSSDGVGGDVTARTGTFEGEECSRPSAH